MNWLKTKWLKFEAWLDRKLPKVKTKLIALAALISSGALALQGFLSGLPASSLINPETLAIANVVVFALVYWSRGLPVRVEGYLKANKKAKK